jgi:hypothetical protein
MYETIYSEDARAYMCISVNDRVVRFGKSASEALKKMSEYERLKESENIAGQQALAATKCYNIES